MTGTDLMDRDEERRLLTELAGLRGDPARQVEYTEKRNEFAVRWRPFVVYVVHRWHRTEVSRGAAEDRIQDGTFGLFRAIDMFDPGRGVRFSTYARLWVRQSVRREAWNDTLIHARPFQPCKGRPRVDRYADQRAKARAVRAAGYDPGSGDPLHRLAVAEPDRHGVEAAEDAALVAAALAALTKTERDVLTLRHGLGGGEPRTMAAAGRSLGRSREWVAGVERRAIRRAAEWVKQRQASA